MSKKQEAKKQPKDDAISTKRNNVVITEELVAEWLSKLHTWEPKSYGGREGAQRAAREAIGVGK